MISSLNMPPRALIASGALIAAARLRGAMIATDLYGSPCRSPSHRLARFTRPGFTAGLAAVPLAHQGGVAGVITSANGIIGWRRLRWAWRLPREPDLPFAMSAALLIALAAWAARTLPEA